MNDVAELTLRVNALEANQASAALDKLETSGKAAAAMSDVLTSGFQRLAAVLGPAALATAFVYAIKGALELEASYVRLAQMAGTTASQISGLALVAATSGTSLESMAAAMAKLNREVGLAKLGDMAAKTQMLKAIGIDPNSGDDPAEVFLKVSRALVGMRDQSIASKVAFDLLGRGFAELRPAMEELVRQGGLHKSVTDEEAAAAKRFEDGLSLLNHQMQLSKIALANDMLPALQAIVKSMNDAYEAGGLLAATIAGIQTAITGTEQYKNDKELVDLTERKLQLMNKIDEVRRDEAQGVPSMGGASLSDWQRQLDAVNEQLKTNLSYRRQLADPTGTGSGRAGGAAPAESGGPNEAELRVRKLLDDQKHYAQRLEEIKAFGLMYAEEIRVANSLADLANKEGGVQNQRTAEALMLEKMANDRSALEIQRINLRAARELEKGKDPEDASGKAAALAAAIEAVNKKIITNEVETQAQIRAARTVTFQLQREQYNAWVASQATLGESIADSLMSQAELEKKGYEDRQNALEIWIKAQGEEYAGGAELRERQELEHQAKLGNIVAQGELARRKASEGTLAAQVRSHTSTFSEILQGAGQFNKTFFELEKIASLSSAIIKGYEAVQSAYAWGSSWGGPPGGAAMAALAAAATAANVIGIASTQFGGGSGGGGGAATGTFAASPSTGLAATAPAAPQAPATVINLRGDTFSRSQLIELFDRINEHAVDGGKITIAS